MSYSGGRTTIGCTHCTSTQLPSSRLRSIETSLGRSGRSGRAPDRQRVQAPPKFWSKHRLTGTPADRRLARGAPRLHRTRHLEKAAEVLELPVARPAHGWPTAEALDRAKWGIAGAGSSGCGEEWDVRSHPEHGYESFTMPISIDSCCVRFLPSWCRKLGIVAEARQTNLGCCYIGFRLVSGLFPQRCIPSSVPGSLGSAHEHI